MTRIDKPFRRTVRPFKDGKYSEGGRSNNVLHPKYSRSPEKYVRAFLLVMKDLRLLFEYVESADKNLKTYSFAIFNLLLRTCIEVEANCKAILGENGYSKPNGQNLNMDDYKKIEKSHRLSSYRVKLPIWTGEKNLREPFYSLGKQGCTPLV